MIELALNGVFQADFGGMDRWACPAYMAAEPLNDPALTATALAVQAAGAAMVGASAAGRGKRELAMRMIDVLSDDALADHLDAIVPHALAEMYLDHLEDGRRHADRARSLVEQRAKATISLRSRRPAHACGFVDGSPRPSRCSRAQLKRHASRMTRKASAGCSSNLSDAASAAGQLDMARTTAEEGAGSSRSRSLLGRSRRTPDARSRSHDSRRVGHRLPPSCSCGQRTARSYHDQATARSIPGDPDPMLPGGRPGRRGRARRRGRPRMRRGAPNCHPHAPWQSWPMPRSISTSATATERPIVPCPRLPT